MNDETNVYEEEDEIILPPHTGLHRVYTYLPYSHWRIKQILNDYYNAHLVCIRGYKEGRYPGYHQHYNIYDNTTGNLIAEHIYLDDLRSCFAKEDFPLHEKKNKRNKNAVEFLKAVQNSINR